jgi:hypothetical protein
MIDHNNKKEDRMIPKEILDAIKTFQNNGFNTQNLKKAVLKKVELELDGKPIKKEKSEPVAESVKKVKTDDELIAEHIQNNGVTKERKGKAKYWDGVKFCNFNEDIAGKKEIGSKVKLPITDLTFDILYLMIGGVQDSWFSCRQLTEMQFGSFDNQLDKTVRIELYKSEGYNFIDKKIEGINRHFYRINKLGLDFINKQTGGR